MKQGNEIDKIFKSGLGEMQLDPPKYVWDNIESALSEKKERKGIWVWLLGLLLISGGVIGSYAYLNNAPENTNSSGILIDSDLKASDKLVENSTKKQDADRKEIISKSNNQVNEDKFSEILSRGEAKVISKASPEVTIDNFANVIENRQLEVNTSANNSVETEILRSPSKNLEKSNKYFNKIQNNILEPSNSINKVDKKILLEKPKKILNQRTLFNIAPLETINNGLTYQSDKIEASDDFIQRNTECYSFAQRGSGRVALEIYGGPAISLKSLRDVTGESLYLTRRNETESARVAMNAGFKVEFGIKPNLSVKTGINYTLLNERFDYQNTMEERITIIYVRDMNGVIIDSTLTREFGTREKTTYNRYHLIDIPILISYSVSTKSLSMALNAGALVNLYFGQKGDIIEPVSTLMPTSITTGESIYPVFKNNVGVSLYAGLSVYYPIRKSIDLVFEPNIRHILRPVTLDVHPIEQSYTVFGTNLGLRFRFN